MIYNKLIIIITYEAMPYVLSNIHIGINIK